MSRPSDRLLEEEREVFAREITRWEIEQRDTMLQILQFLEILYFNA